MSTPNTVEQGALDALTSSVKAPLDSNGEVTVNQSQSATQEVTAPSGETPKTTSLSFGDDMPQLVTSAEAAKPKEVIAPAVEVVVPAVTNDPATQEAPKPGEQTQVTQQPVTPARDYTIFPEDLQAALKKAPNVVYDAVTAYVKRAKEVEARATELERGALPNSYYEHPNAYQFDRTYQQHAATFNQAEFERNHWTEQLGKIRGGEDKITSLVGYDPSTGNPVYDTISVKPEQAGQLEARIMSNISQISSVAQQAQQQALYVRGQFAQQHTQTIQYLRGAEDKFFPDLKDMSKHPRKADYDYFTQQFLPPQMRNNPMAAGLGKAYVAILNRDSKIAELTKKLETYERNKAADALAGPSPSQIAGAVQTGKVAATKLGKGELSFGMFPGVNEDN